MHQYRLAVPTLAKLKHSKDALLLRVVLCVHGETRIGAVVCPRWRLRRTHVATSVYRPRAYVMSRITIAVQSLHVSIYM